MAIRFGSGDLSFHFSLHLSQIIHLKNENVIPLPFFLMPAFVLSMLTKTMINDDDIFYENTNGCGLNYFGKVILSTLRLQMVAPNSYHDDIDETLGSAFETNNDVRVEFDLCQSATTISIMKG